MNRTTQKTLDKKTRKLFVSYSLDNVSNDYDTIKKIVYKCRKKGFSCYFSINSSRKLRYFLIFSDDLESLKNFSEEI